MNIDEQLIRDEGLRLFPYQDTRGKWTIGVGRNLTDCGLSTMEAYSLLANDIAHAAGQLAEHFPWTQALDEARRGALLNMTFNMGIHGLAEFRMMLGAMEQGDWETAAKEMLDSEWAKQVGARADRLAEQVRSGQWV